MGKKTKRARRIVIDACVARAAGGKDAIHPTSKYCRDFLDEVRILCHHPVLTPLIEDEWRVHMSRFASTWFYKMESARKIDRPDVPPDHSLRKKARRVVDTNKEWEEVSKDLPLVEAARATDRLIASRDEDSRLRFKRFSGVVTELANVTWVNPESLSEENPIQWLRVGAPNERSRALGHSRQQ